MATIDERIKALKAQGKSESTSKEYGKLVQQKSKLGGSYSGTSTSGVTGSSIGGGSAVERALQLQRQAVQPAVSAYQSQIPEIQKQTQAQQTQLQAEKAPLEQRYSDLINQIKAGQQTAENRQTVTTQAELARRGILTDTGVGQTELTQALNPITQQYTGMAAEAGYEREQKLRDLANQIANVGLSGTNQQRLILNAIAELQAGAGQTGVQQGLTMEQQAATQKFTEQQAAKDEAYRQAELALRQQAAAREANAPTASDLLKQWFSGETSPTTTTSPAEQPAPIGPGREGDVYGKYVYTGGMWVDSTKLSKWSV